MKPWRIHPAALDELHEAIEYYAALHSDLGNDFQRVYFACRTKIRENPLRYRVRNFSVRRVNLGPEFQEWYIAYMVWKESVVILAIAHAKRRPFYFRRRIKEARRMF